MTHPARGIHRVVCVVRRESLGPLEADEPHRVVKPPPPAPPPPVPALDAYQLVRAITTARLMRDWPTADKLLGELQRLATRNPRAGGEHDSIRD
jgi:hypothetical protein